MKNVIVKALNRAAQKNLSVEETADLVVDYLDIAGEIDTPKSEAPAPPPKVVEAKPKPIDINRTVKRNPNAPAWKTEELYSFLGKFDMSFSTTPDGWQKEVSFRAGLVKDPNGMKGVGVIFQAIESPEFKLNYFFSNESADVDVENALNEVKKSVNNILRRSDKSIPNSTVPLRAIPSDIASMAGFAASV